MEGCSAVDAPLDPNHFHDAVQPDSPVGVAIAQNEGSTEVHGAERRLRPDGTATHR